MSSPYRDEQLPTTPTDLETYVSNWSVHHRLLYALISGSDGIDTYDLQRLYQTVAPVVYEGKVATPLSRPTRREYLEDLEDEGLVKGHKQGNARVWVASQMEDVVDRAELSADGDLSINRIDELGTHRKATFNAVRASSPAKMSEIYEGYRERVEDPNKKRTVQRYLTQLRNRGLIESHGSGRGTYHRIPPDLQDVDEGQGCSE